MMGCRRWLLAAVVVMMAGCRRDAAPASSRSTASPPSSSPSSSPAAAPSTEAPAESSQPLVEEERDRDPRSEMVTIKILADARRKARVFWGRKDLGLAPLEVQRPRNSGPLDLVVLAPGCLPLHTRAFTDRNDKLWLRLYAKEEAPQVLGYRVDEAEAASQPR